MMRPALLGSALVLALGATCPGRAETDTVRAAHDAAEALSRAAEALSAAEKSQDRVAALSETVRAYEAGLQAMRDGMRRSILRERAIRAEFDREEENLTALLGALSSMQTSPEALLLFHPSGPLDTARAGMLLSDVTPAIQARVTELRLQLDELATLRSLQDSAKTTLDAGLQGVHAARTALSKAISERVAPPDATATDIATMQALVNSADTLQGFAATLATIEIEGTVGSGFRDRKGELPPPVTGAVIVEYDQPDAAGVRRPGILLATAPLALVTSPHAATVRYSGSLLDHGEVAILEPEAGVLLVLSGMAEVLVRQGEVIESGAPVGLMGGSQPNSDQILIETRNGSGQSRSETLYIELREGEATLDPLKWFALAGE